MYNSFIILFTTLAVVCRSSNRCSRDFSRLVRYQINRKILPHYKDMGIKIPDACQLHPNRDVYATQEENIIEQTSTRYVCNFCGKSFISRQYMGLHFDNRHPEYVKQDEDVLCFADMCDIMRCDIISGRKPDDFWEISLCLEDELKEVFNKCESVMNNCVPTGLTEPDREELYSRLHQICDFLTCKMYWDLPEKQDSSLGLYLAVKIILTVVMGFSMFLYYSMAYQYFYLNS